MAQILENGEYTIDVHLEGGSGKASVTSPTQLHVDGETITAEIVWSSSNYDYMEVGGESYYPINTGGNSQFTVVIPELDTEIPIKAETVAMSKPHMIDYTLYFDSATAKRNDETFYSTNAGVIGVSVMGALLLTAIGLKLWRKHENKKQH